ncbi:NAD(P)H-dependent oxidoreductase [Nocardia yamanashiensis]|uniref:NAD(P)H-dependent oxidoreductase n=1 Tax=Nocardia yamanashiensis TaxID=209247 RepID=UPI0009FE4F53|nr:NAD(P)H-dependent oxidoreductase [Nocardia yamanashiensis]
MGYRSHSQSPPPVPPTATRLREAVTTADAVLMITPEYNGSLPAVLKNAIDWTSRPYGRGALAGKRIAIIGLSTGRRGGARALEELRVIVGIAGGTVVEGACLAVGSAGHLFGPAPTPADTEVKAKIAEALRLLAA